MVGDDGSGNQIGVASEARWIAAKGCESNLCTTASLLSSGEWILAPTDLAGANPRPDLRPHIVNNSWGGASNDPFFRATVQAWVASGIFPVFSNGNNGPACESVGAPAEYPESYAAGAYDITNVLAEFSSRGISAFGETKPDVAAPGVDVRSAVRGSQYASLSGTSMAAPHITGVVALMWSAAPALVGDIQATRTLLDATARDVEDLTCGGTATNNNLWGEGRVDAFAAVNGSPRCTPGPLRICSVAAFPKRFEGGVGIAATGTVVLNGVAPAGGAVVRLASSAPALVSVPSTVTVPAGATSASFPVTTVSTQTETVVTLTATFPVGTSTTTTLTLLASPTVATLVLNPTTVIGGQPSTGTVTLSRPAFAGGAVVTLTSNNTQIATVPPTFTIPSGQTSGSFTVTTLNQFQERQVIISAGLNGVIRSAQLTVTRTPIVGNAAFDSFYQVPRCNSVLSFCDTGDLVHSRSILDTGDGREPNQPNTLFGACSDGDEGSYLEDMTLERIRIGTLDGSPMAAGKLVRVDTTVFASSVPQFLDIFYAADANFGNYALVGTVQGTKLGFETLSLTFPLPGGPLPVIRGQWRGLRNEVDVCLGGGELDRDDLMFAIGPPPPDAIPPQVTLTSPAPGSVVPSRVTVTATATDNVAVTRVELIVDGTPLAADLTAPYQLTVSLFDGSHQLQVKAYDAANNSASSAIVTVVVDGTGPTVQMLTPDEGAWIRGTINVDVSASDPHGVTRVEVVVAGFFTTPPDTTAPYSIPLDTRQLPDGPVVIFARVFDTLGNEGDSIDNRSVTVDNTPPGVAITSPANGATVTGVVEVTAAAEDTMTGVSQVQFFLDGALRATRTAPPFSWTFDTSALSGVHALTAKARDGAGNESTSEAVIVAIQQPAGFLFFDSFESGNAAQWTTHAGTWAVAGDGSNVFAQTNTAGDAKASAGSPSWTNQIVEAKVKAQSFNGTNRFVAVFARFQDPSNYYFVALRSNGTLQLSRLVAGAATAMVTQQFPVQTGTWYTVRLEVIGSTLKAFVDGVLRAQTTDTRFPSGKIGLGTFSASAVFDDVLVVSGGPSTLPGAASVPRPPNGATGVATNATLAWNAGAGATSHDVYFGTTNPPSFRRNQTGTTFNPGPLAAGTLYFWRIDEKNASGTTAGTTWSFTTAGGTAPGAASNPSPPSGATDVDAAATLSWTAGSGATSHDVYFGTTSTPPFRGNRTTPTFAPGPLSAGTTYFWRVDEKNNAGITRGALWSFTVAGFMQPGAATNPSPANGATNVPTNAVLSWTPGSGATIHQILFGTTNPPPFVGVQSEPSFDPGPLVPGATYFWRIDEIGSGFTVGQLWSFATKPPLFSDNFETGNAAQWTPHSGTWSVIPDPGGGTNVFAQTSTSGDAKASAGSASWTNQVVEAKVKITSFNGSNRFAALYARFQNPSNAYFVALRSNGTLTLNRLVGGAATAMVTRQFPVQTGTWYTVRLEAIGSSLRMYVDGVLRGSATNTQFAAGKIALGTSFAGAVFDDVVVTTP
jgi:hypothetical protein